MARPAAIVIVDDTEDVRVLVSERLRNDDRLQVTGVGGSGAEAVDLARDLQPDLVLLDVSLPDMDGWDAVWQIRSVSPSTRVVIFSAHDERALASKAADYGVAGVLDKVTATRDLPERLLAILAVGGDQAG